MSWQDVKDWVNSMNQHELNQSAIIYTSEFVKSDGRHSNEQKIVGTKKKRIGESHVPRMIAESA